MESVHADDDTEFDGHHQVEEYIDNPFDISDDDDKNESNDSDNYSNNAIFNLMSFSDSRIKIQGLVKKATRTPERKRNNNSSFTHKNTSPRTENSLQLNSAVQTLNDLLNSVHNDTPSESSESLANISNIKALKIDDDVGGNNDIIGKNASFIVHSPSQSNANNNDDVDDHFHETIASPIVMKNVSEDDNSDVEEQSIDDNSSSMQHRSIYSESNSIMNTTIQSPAVSNTITPKDKNSPEYKIDLLKRELEQSRASIVRHVHSASKLREQIHKNRRKYESDIKSMKKSMKKLKMSSIPNADDAKKEIATELMKQHREALAHERQKHEYELRIENERFENYIEMDKEEKEIAFEFVLSKIDEFLED